MIKQIMGKAAYLIAPQLAADIGTHLWLSKQAKLLRQKCNNSQTLEEVVDEIFSFSSFPILQKKSEILQLLKLVKAIEPKYICEIGGAYGGALLPFAHAAAPDAKILSIDIHYSPAQRFAYRYFSRFKQRINCMTADSHSNKTLQKVRNWLAGHKLDFLFIDGDHSMRGVSSDYQMYAPLVRHGGIIGFHDIVPDFKTRFGVATKNDVGQVPAFWTDLKKQIPDVIEIIDDSNQDGYGIGIIKK